MKSRNSRFAVLLAVGAFLFTTPYAFSQGDKGTKAANVKLVTYKKGGNEGYFKQTGNKQWVEYNDDGEHRFTEIDRDEFSIYLKHVSLNYEVQLDLYKKRVLYTAKGKKQRELYTILTASNSSQQTVPAHKKRLENLSKKTKPGVHYAKVPVGLVQFRNQMVEIGNIGRRDPNYRKKNGSKVAIDLSGPTVTTSKGPVKIFKNRRTPPYFDDLVLNDKWNTAAQFQAEYQASINKVTHDGPTDYKGKDLSTLRKRLDYFGSPFPVEGELTGSGAVDAYPIEWMKSDTDYEPWFNIGAEVREIGFGAAQAEDGTWYFCAVVGLGKKNSVGSGGKVYFPKDDKEFKVKEGDVVRFGFSSPASTGYSIVAEVTTGKATITERIVYQVEKGAAVAPPGSGPVEFEVEPVPGQLGKVTVTVTMTPPGGKPEVKEYKFEVVK